MAVKTVTFQRSRTEAEAFSNATLGTAIAAYNSYEATKAADDTKTWTVRIVNAFYDGTNYVIVAEASYPEINEDPTAQVPEIIT